VELYDSIDRGVEEEYVEAVYPIYSLSAVDTTTGPKGDLL
jgi:hypothetical protein